MASFQVKRRDTGIIYNIKVSEFVFRNTYGTNQQGLVTSLEPTGYTSVTTIGDNIVQKLGEDALTQGAWFDFINHPDYSIHMDSTRAGGDIYRLSDPTLPVLADPTTYVFSYEYGNIDIYKEDRYLTSFVPYRKVTCKDINTDNVINNILPNFMINNDPTYGVTFAFNFIQKQIAQISPYYYRVQHFDDITKSFTYNASRSELYGSCTPIYYGKAFTIKNAEADSRYNKNTNQPINGTTIKKYSDLDNMEYVGTAAGDASIISSTFTMRLFSFNATIDGKKPYDFWYWLLNDTDADDNPYPDPDPDNNNNGSGQSKPNTGGNPSGGNNNSDDIIYPRLPSVNPISTGSVNLYQMSATTFRAFMKYLWSNPFYTAFIKLFENPMDAVISSHIIGAIVPTSGNDYITIGNVTTDVNANVVTNNFMSVEFGSITIDEYYRDSSDYLSTIVELYLPYYGYVSLNVMEVMGATISVRYNIDVLTGAFVAMVTVNKNNDGTTINSVLYQYSGNMAYQIPLSSIDYSSLIVQGIGAIGSIAQKSISGLVNNVLNVDIGYDRASTLSSNNGYMSVKQAYVTILRPIHVLPPNFAAHEGFPYEGYVNLGSCTGYTKCRAVNVDTLTCTAEEKQMIKQALLEGVIL